MSLKMVEHYVARILDEQPDPPRRVPLTALLVRAPSSQANLILMVVAGVFAGLGVWVSVQPSEGFQDKRLLQALFGGVTLLAVGGVVLWARRLAWAVRHGLRCVARVSTVRVLPPGPLYARTLDAMSNGIALGTHRVEHPDGVHREDFAIDASWAARVHDGAAVEVIAHPEARKMLMPVRILEER